MPKSIIKDILKTGLGGVIGVIGHHYGGQMLDRENTKAESIAQAERDKKSDQMLEQLKNIKSELENCFQKVDKTNENTPIPTDLGNQVKAKTNEIVEAVANIIKGVEANNSKVVQEEVQTARRASIDLKDIIDNWSNGKNNFISDFNIQVFYDFLDSLTLLEESAFLHILIFILILSCLVSITSIFFGNEIIRYFNLEEKFPRLGLFFKLRAKFQRYYLIWNIIIIVCVSFLAIFLNLLVFYTKLS